MMRRCGILDSTGWVDWHDIFCTVLFRGFWCFWMGVVGIHISIQVCLVGVSVDWIGVGKVMDLDMPRRGSMRVLNPIQSMMYPFRYNNASRTVRLGSYCNYVPEIRRNAIDARLTPLIVPTITVLSI